MSTDLSVSEKLTLSKRRVLLFILAFSIWSFFLVRSIQVFPPGSAHVTGFNSDSAIPVLMSNENRPATAYNTYYYGQDRFGAWPFLIAQLVHRTAGYHWSNRALFILQALWLFVCALLFATMNRSDEGLLAGLLFLLPLCLHPTARQNLFDLSQPYAWQTTALVFSWWCLRRFCEHCFGPAGKNQAKLRHVLWGVLTFWFALLATLSNAVSGPILFFLLVLEVSRALHKAGGGRSLKGTVKRILQAAIPVSSGVVAELLLRMNYHSYSLRHFGTDNRTFIALDRGHLAENFVNQWTRFCNSPWWLLALLPVLALAALSIRYIRSHKVDGKSLRGSLGNLFLKDNALLVIATLGIGVISFIVTVMVSHVRENDYSERFLTLSYLFISFSGLLTLLMLADETKRGGRLIPATVAVACLLLLLFKFPSAETDHQYLTMRETALTLSERAPGAVLLGGYWHTYVFAALDPSSSIVPVPAEGESLRTPWTVKALKESDQVIVENQLPALGGPNAPAPHLVQYGTRLRLIVPRWYVNGEFTFSLYEKE
ncbi:MAG: hypothetical protein M3362_28350 [Acidobacteriota bacterium]|nr:hypothetical protein [Acidobacteriota bacterium]